MGVKISFTVGVNAHCSLCNENAILVRSGTFQFKNSSGWPIIDFENELLYCYFALSSMKLFSGKPPKSRSSMYICGLIPWNYAKLAEAVPIVVLSDITRERVLWFL